MELIIALIIGILVCMVLGAVIGVVFKLLLPRLLGSMIKTVVLGMVFSVVGGVLAAIIFNMSASILHILLFAIIGAISGVVLYAVIAKPKDSTIPDNVQSYDNQQVQTNNFRSSLQHEFQIKICPTCQHTYSDISLNFCLNDGVPLSNVLNVQSSRDPEETVISRKVR